MQYKNSYKKLKINKKDFRILALLLKYEDCTHLLFPTFIASEINIPRTTVEFRLKELSSRGFCESAKKGRERIWNITNSAKQILLQEQAEVSKIENVFGIENIYTLLENTLNKKGVGRIYAVEPSSQVENYHYKNLAMKLAQVKLLQLFKDNEHISETVTGENVLKIIHKLPTKVLKEMYGRVTFINIVPDKYISFKEYIICYLGKTFFIDFQNDKCIIVSDKSFTDSIISVIINLQVFGKRINLNEEIKKILN